MMQVEGGGEGQAGPFSCLIPTQHPSIFGTTGSASQCSPMGQGDLASGPKPIIKFFARMMKGTDGAALETQLFIDKQSSPGAAGPSWGLPSPDLLGRCSLVLTLPQPAH